MKTLIELEIMDGEVVSAKVIQPRTKSNETLSQYARFFDSGCTGWSKDPEHNKFFLRAQEVYANNLLRDRGYLFLNDVYDMLGLPQTKEGQMVGWVYDEKNPIGGNRVDFGLAVEMNSDFINGLKAQAWLDFNVDGCIWDHVWKESE